MPTDTPAAAVVEAVEADMMMLVCPFDLQVTLLLMLLQIAPNNGLAGIGQGCRVRRAIGWPFSCNSQ